METTSDKWITACVYGPAETMAAFFVEEKLTKPNLFSAYHKDLVEETKLRDGEPWSIVLLRTDVLPKDDVSGVFYDSGWYQLMLEAVERDLTYEMVEQYGSDCGEYTMRYEYGGEDNACVLAQAAHVDITY